MKSLALFAILASTAEINCDQVTFLLPGNTVLPTAALGRNRAGGTGGVGLGGSGGFSSLASYLNVIVLAGLSAGEKAILRLNKIHFSDERLSWPAILAGVDRLRNESVLPNNTGMLWVQRKNKCDFPVSSCAPRASIQRQTPTRPTPTS